MNEELIEKLSYEVRNYAHEQNDLYGVSYIRTFELKFAELISKECVKIMEDKSKIETPRLEPTGPIEYIQNNTVDMCSWAIKKHFGVEE